MKNKIESQPENNNLGKEEGLNLDNSEQATGEEEKWFRVPDKHELEAKGLESEKTKEELVVLELADNLTNELLEKHGLDARDTSPEQIQIIKEEGWPNKGRFSSLAGYHDLDNQRVLLRDDELRRPLMEFARLSIHELLHLKEFQSLQNHRGTNEEIPRQSGLRVLDRNADKIYFTWLSEAVVEEAAKQLLFKAKDDQIFEEEMQDIRNANEEHPEKPTIEEMWDKDILYVKKPPKGSEESVSIVKFTYRRERKVLNMLIDKLYENNQGEFKDRQEVFDIFVKAMLTGDTRKIGKLVNDTFGKQTTRKFLEAGEDMEKLNELVESL